MTKLFVFPDTFTLKFNSNPGKVLLPTAPKATRGPDIDMTRIPTQPPFKAYLGNLSYDISESELEKLFEKLNVIIIKFFFLLINLLFYLFSLKKFV